MAKLVFIPKPFTTMKIWTVALQFAKVSADAKLAKHSNKNCQMLFWFSQSGAILPNLEPMQCWN